MTNVFVCRSCYYHLNDNNRILEYSHRYEMCICLEYCDCRDVGKIICAKCLQLFNEIKKIVECDWCHRQEESCCKSGYYELIIKLFA